MNSEASIEVVRPMYLTGEELSFDSYENGIAPAEEAKFREDLARIDQATVWDYQPTNDNC